MKGIQTMVLGYMYALKQMVEMEKNGGISLKELSMQLNTSTQKLKDLFEIMERAGHIEKLVDKNAGTLSVSSQPACSGSFRTCVLCGNCGQCERNAVSSGTIYRLTEKGRRVCNKQTG
ncbi:MAG: FeoC-like transcriptional regulator [Methanosarcinaceae archaeon]